MGLVLECFAFVIFCFAFWGAPGPAFMANRNLIALGLALWVLAEIVGGPHYRAWP